MNFIKFKKQILCAVVGCMLFTPMAANAGMLRVEKFSMPIKLMNRVSQPITVAFSTQGNWKLFVEVMDSQIRNQDNPAYSIPITRLELAQLGGTPIANFDAGKIIEIKAGDFNGANNLNLALNMIDFDCDRPGNYVADIKFTLVDQDNTVVEDIYSLRFMKDEIASIDFSNRLVKLMMDKDKILQKNCCQNLPIPVGLYVTSNKDWKLFVRKIPNSKDQTLKYFVKVLGGDSSINCNTTGDYILMNENPILVASGKSTINDTMKCLDKKLVNIDYQVKGPEDRFIPAGSRSEEFEYTLETED